MFSTPIDKSSSNPGRMASAGPPLGAGQRVTNAAF